ncbi:MAG: 30S ribosomal protein S2 [Candidatus Hodarchaeota archaeon]
MTEDLLIELDQYLAAGIHIGTQVKTVTMEPYIYRVRQDGLYVLDIRKFDERIRVASRMLARAHPSSIAVVGARQYAQKPIQTFCTVIGAKALAGRFIPGTFTNPRLPQYTEPTIVFITDPRADVQAVNEAAKIRVPILALVDTDNSLQYIDLAVPCNNKGRKSLSLAYWLLARQVIRERGQLAPDAEFPFKVEDFEATLRRTET